MGLPDADSAGPLLEAELDLHLEIVPWLPVGALRFDTAAALAEARALAHRFVSYRSEERFDVAGWRGLALHAIDGDETHVAVRPEDAGATERDFAPTPALRECPLLAALVRTLFFVDRSRSISLLWLEGGARIVPHVDGEGPPVIRSLNLALNMPAGCRFWVGLESDGSKGPGTWEVPFRPGSVNLINVARMHSVENDSAEPRIHLVGRGSLRRPVQDLVELARQHTGRRDLHRLRQGVEELYARQGRPVPDHHPLRQLTALESKDS